MQQPFLDMGGKVTHIYTHSTQKEGKNIIDFTLS